MRLSHVSIVCLTLLPAFFLGACATAPVIPEASRPGAVVQTGQLSYRAADSTAIIGDFQMVTGPVFRLDFFKGPGDPLISVVRDGSQASISGAMAGPGWSGAAISAPKQAKTWIYLANAFQPFGSLPDEPSRPLIQIDRKTGFDGDGSTAVNFPLSNEEFLFYFD